MKKSFLFISCNEAKHICDKAQYGEATGWEIFKLKIRLSWCHISQSYSSRNQKLTEVVEKSKVDCLKSNERIKIKEQFDRELAKHQ